MPSYLVTAPVMGRCGQVGTASTELDANSLEHLQTILDTEEDIPWDVEMEWDIDTDNADIKEVE